jgi:hypothetical protein
VSANYDTLIKSACQAQSKRVGLIKSMQGNQIDNQNGCNQTQCNQIDVIKKV